jgi:hypothetical protein
MANTYGISDRDEGRIRARDMCCVYCGVRLRKSSWEDYPTIEHFNNDGPYDRYFNIAMCCRACNRSKGMKTLLEWLKSSYCERKGISEATVARVVRRYLRSLQCRTRTLASGARSSNQAIPPSAGRRG